ncbi:hypothetical protein WJX73_003914 [Symbiochloris irregularis]|uniref:Kinesin-like protein n=1 Tax=Symbiochloris irregularis TaxID=706552 RepID=A0AAW1NVF5_9CHLO
MAEPRSSISDEALDADINIKRAQNAWLGKLRRPPKENSPPRSLHPSRSLGVHTPTKQPLRRATGDRPTSAGINARNVTTSPRVPAPRGTPPGSLPRKAPIPRFSRTISSEGPESPAISRQDSISSIGSVDPAPERLADTQVQVILRVRPPLEREAQSGTCLQRLSSSGITSTVPGHDPQSFTFDHVANSNTTQDDMFRLVGESLVENCLAGYNSSIYAYGQTGSGKTFTMLGDLNDPEDRGLAPRIFEYLFLRIAEEEDKQTGDNHRVSLKCQYLEIYNETISDLLCPGSTNLQLREHYRRGCHVDGLAEMTALNCEDVMSLMQKGGEVRRVGETNMNRESSRSHAVFTAVVEVATTQESGLTNVRYSRINLIDLAGSERIKSSGATGDQLREASNINRSLSTLGRVIMELVEAQRSHRPSHVPYRDSRLTFLLQDSLGGNAKTTIIANISPSMDSAHETMSTLQFAARAKLMRNKARVNQDTRGNIEVLRKEVLRLNRELEVMRADAKEPLLLQIAELQEEGNALRAARDKAVHALESLQVDTRQQKAKTRWASDTVQKLERFMEEVRGQLEAMLHTKVEDGHSTDNEAAIRELLGMAEGRLQAQEDSLASERQQHEQATQQAAQLQQALHASNNEALRRRTADEQAIQEGQATAERHAERAESLQSSVDSQNARIAALEQELALARATVAESAKEMAAVRAQHLTDLAREAKAKRELHKRTSSLEQALAEERAKGGTQRREWELAVGVLADTRTRVEDLERQAHQRESQLEEMHSALSVACCASETARAQASEQAARAARYRRAFVDIDQLIAWARTPTSARRSHPPLPGTRDSSTDGHLDVPSSPDGQITAYPADVRRSPRSPLQSELASTNGSMRKPSLQLQVPSPSFKAPIELA